MEPTLKENLKDILPGEKVNVTYKLFPSTDINRNGYPYGSFKVISDNLHKYVSPEHQAHEALLKLVAVTKDAASLNPTLPGDINKKYFPAQEESFTIYPIQDERYFQNHAVKHAKKLFGIGPTQPIMVDEEFLQTLESKYKAKKEETEKIVGEETKKNTDLIDINGEKIAQKKTTLDELNQNKDAAKKAGDVVDKDIIVKNVDAAKLAVQIKQKMDGGNPLTDDEVKTKQGKFKTVTQEIKTKKEKKRELQRKIKEFENEIMILQRENRDLERSNDHLKGENEKLEKNIGYLDEAYKVLEDYYAEMKEKQALQKSKTIMGGYRVRRSRQLTHRQSRHQPQRLSQPLSRRQSQTHGGSRKKGKQSRKNKSKRNNIKI